MLVWYGGRYSYHTSFTRFEQLPQNNVMSNTMHHFPRHIYTNVSRIRATCVYVEQRSDASDAVPSLTFITILPPQNKSAERKSSIALAGTINQSNR